MEGRVTRASPARRSVYTQELHAILLLPRFDARSHAFLRKRYRVRHRPIETLRSRGPDVVSMHMGRARQERGREKPPRNCACQSTLMSEGRTQDTPRVDGDCGDRRNFRVT